MNFLVADDCPHGAPERVEAALQKEFRRYHRARKLRRAGIVAAIASGAAAAWIAVVVSTPSPVGRPASIAVHPAPPEIAWMQSQSPPTPVHKLRRRLPEMLMATDFVPLPFGDDSLVNESATIVRVELPRSALRLAGFNVAQERANDRVEADVVLGPDGLAHAVRFIGY